MLAAALALALVAAPQPPADPAAPSAVCGMPLPPPATLPPDGSGPVVFAIVLCFERQGGQSLIEPQTYLAYVQTRPSEPSRRLWIPYTDESERLVLARLPPAVGHRLPGRPRRRRSRLSVQQRRHRQARRLQHGRTAARQDHRLRGFLPRLPFRDRRRAQEAESDGAHRLVRRRRSAAPRRRRHPRVVCRSRAISSPRSSP